MDALQILRRQHRDIGAIFGRLAETEDYETRERLLHRLAERLELHLRLEEEVLYPVLWDLGTKRVREVVAAAYEEQAIMKVVLEELTEIEVPGPRFGSRVAAFRDLVESHIGDVEVQMFAIARKLGQVRLDRLGSEMMAKTEAARERGVGVTAAA